MQNGRVKRNSKQIGLAVIFGGISFFSNLNVANIHNYTDVLNAILTLAGFGTTVLFAAYSLIPHFSKALLGLGTDLKFRDRLLFTTICFALLCVLSLIGLIFFDESDVTFASRIYLAFLVTVGSLCLLEMVEIFRMMLKMN